MAKNDQREKALKEATESLKRIQEFDCGSIARAEELGRDLNFTDGVSNARRIVDLFKQVALDALPDFSLQRLQKLKETADSEYNRFQQILKFSVATDANPKATRDSLLQQLESSYDGVFEQISQSVAYSARRSTDFARLEREARASIQSIGDRTSELQKDLEKSKKEAELALNAIRKVAAEQGVSQQAIFFKDEHEQHRKEGVTWLRTTIALTVLTCLYALSSMFLHKIPFLVPTSPYETFQLAVSKLLVFATLVYFLVLSARNYMAHRHNAVVNKHRQNSLVTYKALVEAAGDQANRDIVLAKAAETIFGAQATGFSKWEAEDSKALSMVNVSPSLFKSPGGATG